MTVKRSTFFSSPGTLPWITYLIIDGSSQKKKIMTQDSINWIKMVIKVQPTHAYFNELTFIRHRSTGTCLKKGTHIKYFREPDLSPNFYISYHVKKHKTVNALDHSNVPNVLALYNLSRGLSFIWIESAHSKKKSFLFCRGLYSDLKKKFVGFGSDLWKALHSSIVNMAM